MFLFLTIAIICLLMTFASDLVKLLHISHLFAVRDGANFAELKKQLAQARKDLEQVRKTPSSTGEYAQFVKTMRAEQKLKDVEEKMRNERNMGRIKSASVELIAGYAFKALFSLILAIITIRNRYTPVVIFDERFDFTPLERILSFPTGVPNAVSVPVWVLSCNVTFRLVSSLINRKK